MYKKRVTYFALGALLSAASCTKEAAEPEVYEWEKGEIYFRTSLADVSATRAMDMTLDNLESFQVTCFNTGDIKKDAGGIILPYFADATFIRDNKSSLVTYKSSPAEGPRDWPEKDGLLKFYAFSPSCNVMMAGNAAITEQHRADYFNLINNSKESGSTVSIDYKLGTLRVNPDISGQFDFVTASASGERWKDFAGGVALDFKHQMSRVELKAWGANPSYNFEIAGIRLGNPVVEGAFNLASGASGSWETSTNTVKGKVEYIFRAEDKGDKIFCINATTHSTPETAGSLMGTAGAAMVIPTFNTKWEGLADQNIDVKPYSTEKMYFSVLLRVTGSNNGNKIYPYPGNPDNMTVIYYAVANSGEIISRLYPGDTPDTFYRDEQRQQPYTAAEDEEIKDFGWAAIPIDVDWEAGKSYVYTLNYSEGIGIHDPQDPDPGRPIGVQNPITWGVAVSKWDYAVKNEDYDPDLDVP
ncbi:MAG: fimbrillin family protein [Muribaculaceae bacterium]|nr:fimbrillin family protein [Muribaculaceae bacterium]MDE6794945.1 fimbrillin family protein [Muribaculaceae bacterium]